MEKIPVATVVTAYDDPLSGTTVILVCNRALCFGRIMGQSLISTNQVCSHERQLSDDPYNKNRPLGIVDYESDWYMPFTVQKRKS